MVPEFIVRRPMNYTSPLAQWMVTKCAYITSDKEHRDKCENSSFDHTFESIIPVTDTSSNVIYRNIFCAYCSGVKNISQLKSWTFKIGCNDILQLPQKNILTKMEESECSIVFYAPKFTSLQTCTVISHTISTCNETGLWPVYNEMVDLACNAFVHPFNITYKNYFCYVCNVDTQFESDRAWCVDWFERSVSDFTPPFSAILDLDKIRRWENDELLNCDIQRQFEDYKLVRFIGCLINS